MRIDNTNLSPLSSHGQPPADAHAGMSTGGAWRGNTVQVARNECDILADAAEEISFAHSERTESRKLEERAIENRPSLLLPRIEAIQQYLEQVGRDNPRQQLDEFVASLKQREGRLGGNPNGPRDEARQRFGSVTEQFLALSYAAQELAREGGHGPLLDAVQDALEDLNDDFGGHIRADLNTVGVAASFGRGDAQQTAGFQSAYRDAVLGGEGLAGMLKGALDRFGEKDYPRAVGTLIQALGEDLSAIQGSSVSPTRLNAVLQELYLLEVLSTVLEACQKISSRVTGERQLPLNAGELMHDLVSASSERWTSGGRFIAIADKHGVQDTAQRIDFFTSTKALVRNMPPKVFPDNDARINTVSAVQEALDDAIEREDA